MKFEEITDKFEIDKKSKRVDRVQAKCPCHNDKNASLTISYNSKEEKTMLYCHAGCNTKDIVESIGLKMSDLFDKPLEVEDKHKSAFEKDIEAIYKFYDENGDLAYEKIRKKGKKFLHRRYIDGETVWGMEEGIYTETFPGSKSWSIKERPGAKKAYYPGQEQLLYNLPNVIKGIKEEQTIFITEGEKDSDSLITRGLIATTTSIGATKGDLGKKWPSRFNSFFKGANVVLLPDNDEPGKRFMEHIAIELKNIANNIKIVELPDLSKKEDITDWLEYGNDIYDLQALVKRTDEFIEFKGNIIYDYNWSDVGNAERLISLHGKDIKFNVNSGKWYVWNGVNWELDNSFKVENLYRTVLRRFQNAIPNINISDDEIATKKQQEKAKSFVLRNETDGKIKSVLNQAKTFKGINFMESDKDDYLFNTPNGTINLRDLSQKKHDRKDLITQCSNYSFNRENDKCPNWIAFLNRIFCGDQELINYVQKAVGYSLTGDMSEQCLFMLWGGGANGKSTFVKALEDIMGSYAATIKGETLMEKNGQDGARGDLARLTNKRVVIASELQEGQVFNEPLLKVLSAGETLPVRFMYQEEFMLKPKFKLWIMTNKKPKVKGNDHGIWRRWRMIPFKYKFTEKEKDPNFYEEKLKPELEGILLWAITGYQMWKEQGFEAPKEVMEAVEDYKMDMDQVARFIEDCCKVGEGYECTGSAMYDEYINWCIAEGENYKMTNHKLARDLKEKGFVNKRDMNGKKWIGIGVNSFK
ncbi:phage/plasmid primase, P4 family [Clostridium perfringens]|uniref:phage/plasmid primase, P4 family n=1 Tax=Clostridium perfringens TaxID=1502 RepID=UPI001C871F7C|nr:phage/plasmid primase, P4 family [Clostridium perfringens]